MAVLAHAFNFRIRKALAGVSKFEASLDYRVNSRTAKAIHREIVSPPTPKKKTKRVLKD